jgi:hypothetical protein
MHLDRIAALTASSSYRDIIGRRKYRRLVLVVDFDPITQTIIETPGEYLDPKMFRARVAWFSSETMAGEYDLLPLDNHGIFPPGQRST